MAGENLHLSMLLTAQAEQARRELAATAQAARELGKAGPEVGTAWAGARPVLDATARAGRELGSTGPLIVSSWSGLRPVLDGTATAATAMQGAVAGLNRETQSQVTAMVSAAQEAAAYRLDLDQIRATLNPLAASLQAYQAGLQGVIMAEELGAISSREAALIHDQFTRSIIGVNAAAQAAGVPLTGMSAAATTAATGLQQLIERTTGVEAASQGAAAASLRQGLALDALRAKYNPVFAASREYEMELRNIAEAERLGALSALEAATARDRAAASLQPMTARMTQLGQATNANVFYTANLAAQFNDIAVMAAFQNPLQLALQQGTQINQVFNQMGGHREAIRSLGPAFLSIINPMSLATIGVIALGVAGFQWLNSLREEALSAADALDALDESIGTLREASRLATPGGLNELEERYGRITAQVERLIAARERLALIDNRAQLDALGASISETAGGRWFDFTLSDEASGILALRRNLDLGRRDAEILRGEIIRLGDVTEPAELADQYARLAEMVERVITELGSTDERRQFLADLLEAEDRARQIAAIIEQRGQRDNSRAEQMLAENALAEATLRYGEDSRIVTEMRAAAERQAYQEMLRTLDVSDELKEGLLQSWDAGRGLAAVDMASGIARARAEAQAMADEIMRAVGAAQSLAAQGAASLEDARIRSEFTNPVDQAYQLGAAQMRRAQGVRRDGAEGVELAALDAEVNLAGRTAAEIARLNEERTALNRNRRDGARASAQERDAVEELIIGLQTEIELLRESDPVQQEMIRHRETLAAATEAERAQVEELIRTRERETEVQEANQRAMEDMRDLGRDVLRGIVSDLRAGASAGDILTNVLDRVLDRIIEIGTNSLSDALLGPSGSSSGGLLGQLLASLLNIKLNAKGDVIGAPTLFAYGDKPGQLGMMAEDGPEAIMPLTHAMGPGVGAISGGRETTLPLTRLSSGKLGVSLPPEVTAQPFAQGGSFGYVPAPPTAIAGGAGAVGSPTVVQLQPVLVNNTSTPMEMEVEETTDARGQRQQKYILSEAVGEGLATPGGRGGQTMRQVYGLRRSARRRQG